MHKEAMLYASLDGGSVACGLCQHRCHIEPGEHGVCGVRRNQNGRLFTRVYGEVIAAHVDPIEKKPLFHFLPGTHSLSVATMGCNFRCSFCQNWQISQGSKGEGAGLAGRRMDPVEIVAAARKQGCLSISYTYTEPTIYFEYAYDTARLAVEAGLFNVFVTNGYMTPEAVDTIRPYLHACNVDLKSFQEDFYRRMCGARLAPVLETIRLLRESGIWVEVTTLVIPGQNDSEQELTEIATFIADVDRDIPWHISRFHPDFQYQESPATPVETLRKAHDIGRNQGLRYIYLGNVWGEAEDTACPSCGLTVIGRRGFSITADRLEEGKCPSCGAAVAGLFNLNNL
ncbi:MAG: AmmeMemoRadiSam system radical SAM enzyme [Candidatus Aminicenantaceae bacterium]